MGSVAEERNKYLSMNINDKRKLYKCGNKYVTLDNVPNWQDYAKMKGITSKVSDGDYAFNREINKKVSIFVGDITALEIDAIVNAANRQLGGGGGVDGAIHSAAGFDLLQGECRILNSCDTGDAKITGGYKLPAKYVIHTVGPVGEKPGLLSNCYQNSLRVMEENKLKSIAFPCVSTGVYGYPNENAAHVAIGAVRKWMDNNEYAKNIDRIIFCLFLPVDVEAYHRLMPFYFPTN
ncbi:MACRO domain-containing protein-like protein [Leptotrombidium deliense]|uniref:MACRO domain-containing protein-like protein n=1 Tax=Leptotrombidium deliense TaxID=299467 RepID=A0A443S7A5_9ACAR|nr:MACRO domain-containing protein-like protein [Leptotrombidium deliense]